MWKRTPCVLPPVGAMRDGAARAQETGGLLRRRQFGRVERLLFGARGPGVVERLGRADRHAVTALDALVFADLRAVVAHLKHAGRAVDDAEPAPDAFPGIDLDEILAHDCSPEFPEKLPSRLRASRFQVRFPPHAAAMSGRIVTIPAFRRNVNRIGGGNLKKPVCPGFPDRILRKILFFICVFSNNVYCIQ